LPISDCSKSLLPSKRNSTLIAADCPDYCTVATPYAQYVVTSKKLHFRTAGSRTCIVFSKGWPGWFWAVQARKIQVSLICLQDISWLRVIKHFSPSTEVIAWSDVGTISYPVVDCLFSDYNLKGTLKPILHYVTQLVVATKALSDPPGQWQYFKKQVHHHHCGGVTDSSWILHIYTSIRREDFNISREASRDFSKEPAVIGRGLIPWRAVDLRVVVPSVFSTTKWSRRRLTTREHLLS